MKPFDDFFRQLTALERPWSWQRELAEHTVCVDRLVRIPTGFGKTLGVLAAWLWHRVEREDARWPLRLVWCLPMRTLVEQTAEVVEAALRRSGHGWDGHVDHAGRVGVHRLLGGTGSGDWHLYPEHAAVLVGTQDMLLSRALNRGYGAPRARWPMEFGLLNHDCLWVMDEVQLMDVGLATSAQLQAFRDEDVVRGRALRPCRSWWMSATLQRDWLAKSPDTATLAQTLPLAAIAPLARTGPLWDDVAKPCSRVKLKDDKALAGLVGRTHLEQGRGARGPTLVVLNTVERAVQLARVLRADRALRGTEVRLVHSRFRPAERTGWGEAFLNRAACAPHTDRIVVATQVIEAGVDVSAAVLVTELAPWPSLVQRFGRCARWGGVATVIVADFEARDDKAALPYERAALDAAREALAELADVAPLQLEAFEERHPERLVALYPYAPRHLVLRHELDELFDTTPDLSGADVDVSRFIRAGEERDLQVFWSAVPAGAEPDARLRPAREALCAVPFLKARDWLCGPETASAKAPRLKPGRRAWVWDWLDGRWRRAERRDLYPGQTVLVAADGGGYDPDFGWSPESTGAVAPVIGTGATPDDYADAGQDDETLSVHTWQTIAVHGREAGRLAAAIARALAPELAELFDLAGRWHDAGKAHPAFNGSIVHAGRPRRCDLAKAPDDAWLPVAALYPMPDGSRRPGFRHELASTLALFAVLQRCRPEHPALLGPWRELLAAIDAPVPVPAEAAPGPLEQEVLALDARRFDLLAYLVCAHHGKVRLAWHAAPADQAARSVRLRIRGIEDGDELPSFPLAGTGQRFHRLPATRLDLAPAAAGLSPRTGASWTERVLGLLDRHGPFTLAWLEALLRAADQRASRLPARPDPLLETDHVDDELDGGGRPLAQVASGGAPAPASGGDPPSRGALDGDGRGAGGREPDSRTTRPPHTATRYLETELGRLSYQALAPHLAERVARTERAIALREFAQRPLEDALLLDLHQRICGDLVPAISGRWRLREVQVGSHRPPPAWQVPMLMRDYAADLTVRVAHAPASPDEHTIETLAFAEGRLLHVHPFEDFNGRVTRLFLLELLYRLDLPIVDPATDPGAATERYFAALRAYDAHDPRPLAAIWRARFETEAGE